MPIHDWTRVDAGLFHDFHLSWIAALRNRLNKGVLPEGYYALAEQRTGAPIGDVVTLTNSRPMTGGLRVLDHPIHAKHKAVSDRTGYARKASRLAVRHVSGVVVAVIEIVSPGNKSGRVAMRQFVNKATGLMDRGVHFLYIDLFPPSRRDPNGLHALIWNEYETELFSITHDEPLSTASYCAGNSIQAIVETFAVGQTIPEVPLFLDEGHFVMCPSHPSYLQAWDEFPNELKPLLTTSASPSSTTGNGP